MYTYDQPKFKKFYHPLYPLYSECLPFRVDTKTPTIVKKISHILFIETSTICAHHSGNLIIESTPGEKTWVGHISRTYSTKTKGTAAKVFLLQADSCLELECKREK